YRIEYPPELEADLSRIEAQMRAPDYLEGSREDLLRRRPDAEAVDRLWFHQLKDMFDRFPFIRYTEVDDSILLTSVERSDSDRLQPELVHAARTRLGDRGVPGSTARKVLEVRMSYADLRDRTIDQLNSPEGAFDQIGGLQSELQEVLKQGVQFTGESADGNVRIARIPALSYVEALLQEAVGAEKVQFHFVDGAIPRDQVMRLRSRRVSPVGLGRGLLWLGDIPNWVHPGAFAVHDGITHTCIDSAAVPGSYELAQRFYDWFRFEVPKDAGTENILNRLADGQSRFESIAGQVLGRDMLAQLEGIASRILAGQGVESARQLGQLSRLLGQARQAWLQGLRPEAAEEVRLEARRWENLFQQVTEATRPRIVYPPEVEAAWQRIEQSFARSDYYRGNRSRLARVRADIEDVDTVWHYQAAHLAEAMKKMSGEWVDAEAILEINPPGQYPEAARLLREALALLGERGRPGSRARQVLLVRGDEHSETDLEWAWERYIESAPVVNMMEQFTGGRFRLENHFSGAWRNYVPSLSLLEALYSASFGRRVQFHPVPGEISRDTAMELRRRSVSPIGFSRQLIHLSHFENDTHPMGFSGHDGFYHAGVIGQMGERYPRIAGYLYDHAQERLPRGQIREDFLDSLADLNVAYRRDFGLKMFRKMMEEALDPTIPRIQEAESFEEFEARAEAVLANVEGFRALVRGDFDAEPSLARAKPSFLGSLDAIERRIQTARRLREASDSVEIGATPIRYDNLTLDAIQEIERHYARPDYYEGSREELLAKRPPLVLADQLWFDQARDYAQRIPGASIDYLEAEALLEPLRPDPRFDRSLLESALQRLPQSNRWARHVMKISLPPEMRSPFYGRPENPELRFLVGPPMTRFFESFLDEKVQLSDGHGVFLIPSLSLAESLAQAAHGSDRVQFHFVPGLLPRNTVSSLHSRRVSPVSLSGAPVYFPDFNVAASNGSVHPWSLSQHDVFEHATSDGRVPAGVAEAAHWIYTRGRQSFPDSNMRENLLNQLSDLALANDKPGFAALAELMARPWIEAHRQIPELSASGQRGLELEARTLAESFRRLVRQEFDRQPDLAANRQRFERLISDLDLLFDWAPVPPGRMDYLSRIEYSPDLEANWDAIETQFGRRNYLSAEPQWRERNRMPEDWVDRHWQFQIQDWARSIPGVQSRVLDLGVYFQPSAGRDLRPDTEFVGRAVAALGDRARPGSLARQVVEIDFPAKVFERFFHGEGSGERSDALLGSFFSAEEMLDRRILMVEPTRDSILFRIPSLSFYEKVLQAQHGAERVSFHYVPGGISRRQVMDFKRERAFPIGLARNNIFFGDLEELVHPFYYTAHDAFVHATRDAAVSIGFSDLAGRAYRHLERSSEPRDDVADYVLGQLAELDHQARDGVGLSALSRDLIYLLNRDFQRAQALKGGSRRQAMAELDALSGGVHAWIAREAPSADGLNPPSLDSIQALLSLRRSLGDELRPAAPGGRRSE
ncbi:MAG TPA: hypothetical protein VJR29_11030, partial [bacterium]|nr:hypothetical protein [bacterium]